MHVALYFLQDNCFYLDFNAKNLKYFFSGTEDPGKIPYIFSPNYISKKIPNSCFKNRLLDHQLNLTGRIFLPSVGNTEVDGQGQL
jgi:hypothetical protein